MESGAWKREEGITMKKLLVVVVVIIGLAAFAVSQRRAASRGS